MTERFDRHIHQLVAEELEREFHRLSRELSSAVEHGAPGDEIHRIENSLCHVINDMNKRSS